MLAELFAAIGVAARGGSLKYGYSVSTNAWLEIPAIQRNDYSNTLSSAVWRGFEAKA